MWEDSHPAGVGEKAGKERRTVGYQGRNGEQLPRAFAQIANGGCYQSDDDERNGEREELAEQRVECYEHACRPVREKLPEDDTGDNRDDYLS